MDRRCFVKAAACVPLAIGVRGVEASSARIAIARAADEPVAIEIRRPEWADAVDCRVETRAGTEGQAEPTGPASSGYQRLHRRWKAGDVLVVRYQMKQRSQASGEDRRSFWYGPWLLGASAAENPDYFNELTKENKLLGDSTRLPGGRDRRGGSFSVPAAETAFRYAPAEYPDQPGTVILLPVAEQTGQGSTSWEVSFRRASA